MWSPSLQINRISPWLFQFGSQRIFLPVKREPHLLGHGGHWSSEPWILKRLWSFSGRTWRKFEKDNTRIYSHLHVHI